MLPKTTSTADAERQDAEIQQQLAAIQAKLNQIAYNVECLMEPAPDGFALPPAELHYLVTHHRDYTPADFFEHGRAIAADIQSALAECDLDINEAHSILDFGCG